MKFKSIPDKLFFVTKSENLDRINKDGLVPVVDFKYSEFSANSSNFGRLISDLDVATELLTSDRSLLEVDVSGVKESLVVDPPLPLELSRYVRVNSWISRSRIPADRVKVVDRDNCSRREKLI